MYSTDGLYFNGNTVLDSDNSSVSKSGETLTVKINGTSQSLTNTTYSANNGVGLSGTTFYNSGVRAVSISGNSLRVNTNGTNTDLTIPYATDADTLDGLHLDRVVGTYTREQIGTSPNFDNPSIQNGLFEMRISSETTGETGTKPFNGFAPFLTLKVQNVMMQLAGGNSYGWFIRGKQSANVTMANTDWQQLARTTDNVASATKLETARTIWGQSFDGTANVSGNLTLSNAVYLYGKNAGGTSYILAGVTGDNTQVVRLISLLV